MADRFTIDAPDGEAGTELRDPRQALADSAAHIFRLGGEWYFSTREGDIGPFRTREQAKREALAHHSVLRPARNPD